MNFRSLRALVAGLCIAVLSVPLAAATEGILPFEFTVKSIFTLTISESELDFGSMSPGDSKEYPRAVTVVPKTNTGNPWSLQISAAGDFINTLNSRYTAPISSLKWTGLSATSRVSGTFIQTQQAVSQIASVIYDSPNQNAVSVDNVNTDTGGTIVNLKFDMELPFAVNAGDYESVILFTLTEG